jgi:arabinose-5-phosphate isomerase
MSSQFPTLKAADTITATDEEIVEYGKEAVRLETEALEALVPRIDENFARAVKILFNCKGRVVLTGVGKSGLIARKIVATLNSTGAASIYLHPTDALHGDLGMVRSEDAALLLSKSGATDEIAALLTMFKRLGVPTVAMVGEKNSRMGGDVDVTLDVGVEREACPFNLAPTSSTTAMLAMGDALSIALLRLRRFTPEDFALLHPGGSLGKRLSLRIKEIMITGEDVPIVSTDTPLKDTIIEMTSKRLGSTAVIDETGTLVGVITDGDLRRLLERTSEVATLKAEDAMTRDPKTIDQNYLASFALQQMERHKITALIVADADNKPIGVVHLHELVNLGLRIR